MAATEHDIERARSAARSLFDDPDAETYEPTGDVECAAAVAELTRLFTEGAGTFRVMLARSRDFAGMLSSDRLQGLSEIVQNADDVKASEVTFRLRDHALTAVHNGTPARLRDVHALSAPWLSTKADNEEATGRFGIGLSTLHSLADSFDFHSSDYHVRLGSPTIATIDQPTTHTTVTILQLQLRPGEVNPGDLLEWAASWDDASLLFLRSVRTITFDDQGQLRTLRLAERRAPVARRVIAGRAIPVHRAVVGAPDGRTWTVERADPPSPEGLHRAYKATGKTTSIAIALPHQTTDDRGAVAARLPLAGLAAPAFLNAEFDPTVGRQALASNQWNRAVVNLVIDLWTQAVLDRFATDPKLAWHAVPIADPVLETTPDAGLLLQHQLTHDGTAQIGRDVRIPIGDALVPLAETAVEDDILSGLLTDAEIAELAGTRHTLPAEARDDQGRWRQVLATWQRLEAKTPTGVAAGMALTLAATLDDEERATALAAAAIKAGAQPSLFRVAWVQLADGKRTTAPARGSLPILTTDPANLAIALRIGERVSYDCANGALILDWLGQNSTLGSELSNQDVLEHLARIGSKGGAAPVRLADQDLARLRAALEEAAPAERQRLGPGIGHAIQLDAIRFKPDGSREHLSCPPAAAYLPFAIDKDTDSFASAARKASGPVWIDPHYQDVLRSAHGREGFGARAMLTTLGARTAPTFEPHPQREYAYGSRRGLPSPVSGNPAPRENALRDQSATHSLDDQHSPDLDAVLDDIASDAEPKRRRRRAHALLTTLARLWPQVADHAHVQAATGYYTWHPLATLVPSWWLARLQDVAWLDDETATPRRPIELRQPTQTNKAAYGESPGLFAHADLNEPRFEQLLHDIGVPGEPPTEDFLNALHSLRKRPEVDEASHHQAADIYRAIAARLQRRSAGRRDLAVNASQLRQVFAAQTLLLTTRGWRAPSEAFRGDPVFGAYRPFAPKMPDAEALWRALRIPEPSISDCLGVLRDLSKSDPARPDDETVHLETLRLLDRLLAAPPPADQAAKLRQAPIRTSHGWVRKRPVFAVDDPSIVAGIGRQLPMWLPGGGLAQFSHLLEPLRITQLPTVQLASSALEDQHENEDLTAQFHAAAEHLRDDLARNEPHLHGLIRIAWDELTAFRVLVASALAVDVLVPGEVPTTLRVPVHAHLDPGDGALRVRVADDLDDPDGAGRAIAGLFAEHSRQVTYAWLAAVHAARRSPAVTISARTAVELAEDQAVDRPPDIPATPDALERLQSEQQRRRERASASSATPNPRTEGKRSQTTSPPRELVDINTLELIDSAGRIVQPDTAPPTQRKAHLEQRESPPPAAGGASPQQHTAPRAYTDLDKETLGLDLLRWVLASEENDILDLRTQHRIGADAIDGLHRYYELKVYARDEPDTIRLEGSERRTALAAGEDFFLVVISGLEGRDATPTVRIVDRPLEQLTLTERSVVEYSGVRRAHSLLYPTRRRAPKSDT